MNILLVNDYKNKIAGAETYMYSLKEELEKRGHSVSLFGTTISKEQYIKTQSSKTVGSYIKKIFNVTAYFEFKKCIEKCKPDVIHLQNIFNELSPSILLATESIPVVMTVHDNQLVNAVSMLSERTGKECKKRTCGGCINCVGLKGALYEKIKRKIHKRLLKKISLYITPSKYMKGLIEEAGFKPVVDIPNGIKLFNFSKIKNFDKLLYVGRLTKDKGVEYLLRAMPDIISIFSTVELTLVGDGTDKDYFINIAKELKIMGNTKFIVDAKSNEIERYYQESTIVVIPSIYNDNFPTVCIEALSVGRPILGTKKGGIPEIVKNNLNGFIVQSNMPNKISTKLTELLSYKDKIKKMSESAYERSQLFSLKNYIDKIEKIYISF